MSDKKDRDKKDKDKKEKKRKKKKDKESRAQDRKVAANKFYPPDVVASMVTMLLLGANEEGTPYDSFRGQLTETMKKARSTSGQPTQDLADRLETVIEFHDDGNNADLFLNAHLGVKVLLTALVKTGRWSPCLFVSRADVFDVARLPRR